ncbi:hypothetical protein H4S07_002589, partial [Coemansia furcata]
MSEIEAQVAGISLEANPKAKGGEAATPSLAEPPAFIEHRNRIFDELYQKQQEEIA